MLNSYYLIFWIGEVANHSTKFCINLNLLNLILVRNRLRIYLIFWIPRMRIQIISNTFKLMINSPILLEWKRDKLTLRCTKKDNSYGFQRWTWTQTRVLVWWQFVRSLKALKVRWLALCLERLLGAQQILRFKFFPSAGIVFYGQSASRLIYKPRICNQTSTWVWVQAHLWRCSWTNNKKVK